MNRHQMMFKAWKARFFMEVASEQLSPALVLMIGSISRLQPISGVELAKELHITKGAVAQFVDVLDKHGLITRTVHAADRRIAHLSLTKKGEATAKRIDTIRYKIIKEVTRNLSENELKQALEINDKILDQLQQ